MRLTQSIRVRQNSVGTANGAHTPESSCPCDQPGKSSRRPRRAGSIPITQAISPKFASLPPRPTPVCASAPVDVTPFRLAFTGAIAKAVYLWGYRVSLIHGGEAALRAQTKPSVLSKQRPCLDGEDHMLTDSTLLAWTVSAAHVR